MHPNKLLKKRWVKKHLKAGLIPGLHSKHARQRVKLTREQVRARKGKRKITMYEAGRV